MRASTLLPALLVVAVVVLPSQGHSAGGQSKLTGTLQADYFTIHYDPADPLLAELIANAAHEELLRISRDLGYTPEKNNRLPLYVYRSHYDFIQAGGRDVQKFTVGLARGDQGISVDASGAFVSSKEVLAHEITHAVIARILGRNAAALPLWVNEGLAMHQSQAYDDGEAAVANAAASGTLMPLAELAASFPRKRADLAYAQSASAIRYMSERHGNSAPRTLLAALAETGSFDQAMRKATGMSADEFADHWYARATRRYRTVRVVRIVGALLGMVMALLAVVAFLVRRRQKIEAARRWEMEEFDERMNRELRDWWR